MRGISSGKSMVILFFLRTSLWHTYQKRFHSQSSNLAIHFPWVAKMLQNKQNLLHLQITQNTLSKDIPVCL